MSDQSRTDDGGRDTVALLEAFVRGDLIGAQAVLDHCDPGPTIFALASAWLALVEFKNLDAGELLDSMRQSLGGAE